MKEFSKMVGANIRRARWAQGDTQAGLAEKAGLSPNYIARLERGELGASLFCAGKIAGALGITLDELVCPDDASVKPKSQGALARRRAA